LVEAIRAHRAYLVQTGNLEWRERARAAAELETIIQQESLRQVMEHTNKAQLAALIDRIVRRELDPYSASRTLLGR
jgi:LAO/AO transport system kinase